MKERNSMKNEIVIISASKGFNKELDKSSTERLIAYLTVENYAYKQVIGRYKGVTEVSFVVKVDSEAGMEQMLKVAVEFNQTNILYVKKDDTACLVYCDDGASYEIGKFNEVEIDSVSELEDTTYDPTTQKYWRVT
jgi:hypothetical protein